jgi:hypothetical protein
MLFAPFWAAQDIVPGIEYIRMAKDVADSLMQRHGGSLSGISRGVVDSAEGYQAL